MRAGWHLHTATCRTMCTAMKSMLYQYDHAHGTQLSVRLQFVRYIRQYVVSNKFCVELLCARAQETVRYKEVHVVLMVHCAEVSPNSSIQTRLRTTHREVFNQRIMFGG